MGVTTKLPESSLWGCFAPEITAFNMRVSGPNNILARYKAKEQSDDGAVRWGRQQSHRDTEEQEGSCRRNTDCCHCVYWSQARLFSHAERIEFQKEISYSNFIPESSFALVFICLSVSLSLWASLFSHQIWFSFRCFLPSLPDCVSKLKAMFQ